MPFAVRCVSRFLKTTLSRLCGRPGATIRQLADSPPRDARLERDFLTPSSAEAQPDASTGLRHLLRLDPRERLLIQRVFQILG